MALADYTSLKAKQLSPSQHFEYVKSVSTTGSTLGRDVHSVWKSGGTPGVGVSPTAAAVCDRTTVGGLAQVNPSAGELRAWLRRIQASFTTVSSIFGISLQMVDRLVHMGGLDATSVAAQTVSTSALTRSTAGCMAGVEVYTAIGTTPTTYTTSYTNQAGTAGQVSQPTEIGGAGRQFSNCFMPMSLAAGDTAVKAISTVTLAASTGTAGNFGLTLYKPISPIIPLVAQTTSAADPLLNWGGYAALIDTDACVTFLLHSAGALLAEVTACMDLFED